MSFLSVSKCRIKVWHSHTSIKSQEVLLCNVTVMGTTVCKMWLQTTSGKKSQIAKWQINGRLICRHHWFVNTLGQGRIPPPPPPTSKIGKKKNLDIKSWFFTRNTPKMFAPLFARRNFFKCAPPPPLTWNPGSAPDHLIENQLVIAMTYLNNCWVGVKQQSLTVKDLKCICC